MFKSIVAKLGAEAIIKLGISTILGVGTLAVEVWYRVNMYKKNKISMDELSDMLNELKLKNEATNNG